MFNREKRHRLKRRQWIAEHFRCPVCAEEAPASLSDEGLSCRRCDLLFPLERHALNCITPDMRADFNIVETENVSAHRYDGIAMRLIETGGMVLDCGSGKKDVSFPNLIQSEIVDYPLVDVLAVNQTLPFASGSFDALMSLDVLEHVDQPFDCAEELLRVLRPGGEMYVNVPFLQQEHGYPHHYFGMTRMGLRRLFGDRVEVVRHEVPMSGHPIWGIWLSLNTYLRGLPDEEKAAFGELRIKDIVARQPADWLKEPVVRSLGIEARWKIATTTTLVAKKC